MVNSVLNRASPLGPASTDAPHPGRPPRTFEDYVHGWERFFDSYASSVERWRKRTKDYHRAVARLTQFYVPPRMRVLEVGSGNGDLLAAVHPARGVGIDLSTEMTRLASSKYPEMEFRRMAAERLDLGGEKFDYIILSDLLGYLYDIQAALEAVRAACHDRTRIVLNWHSKLWQPILWLAEKLRLKRAQPVLNWTTAVDVENLLELADFEVVRRDQHILVPKYIPGLSAVLNRVVAHLPGFRWLCLTNWIIARPRVSDGGSRSATVSVVCPCRNEAGNIEELVRRIPEMGARTEILLVEGNSTDDTLARCHQVAMQFTKRTIRVLVQDGVGKADAVRLGFAEAEGDVLMILDSDLSVAPEDLSRFHDALVSARGEFINGSRLVYAMDPRAMRFLNMVGNKFFAMLLTWLLGQPVRDTLCGTKVVRREDYNWIADARSSFGVDDPFGDFDLLFGAARLNLRILELPVRYRERAYGSTNISRFSHGWELIRISAAAATKLRFIA